MTEYQGQLVYQCRRCNQTYLSAHVPDVNIAQAALVVEGKTPQKWGIVRSVVDSHLCEDNNIGITDLIGIVKDSTDDK